MNIVDPGIAVSNRETGRAVFVNGRLQQGDAVDDR